MQKPLCKNTPQYLMSCCSPIGQSNTKDLSAQSGGSIGRAVWKWSVKSRFPGAFFALLVNIRRFISLPDLFPLAPTNRPWVSEDGYHGPAFPTTSFPGSFFLLLAQGEGRTLGTRLHSQNWHNYLTQVPGFFNQWTQK